MQIEEAQKWLEDKGYKTEIEDNGVLMIIFDKSKVPLVTFGKTFEKLMKELISMGYINSIGARYKKE